MTRSTKQIIAVVLAVLVLGVAYYGSYLPLVKSQAFIDTMRKANGGGYRTVAEFESGFSAVLDAPSPIGQEELVRNLGSIVMSAVGGSANNPKVVDELIRFVSSYSNPIIESGRGMSFGQDLFIMGNINQIAAARTKDPKYFAAAREYYLKGLALAPLRPQFLYGLFDLYRAQGDRENAKLIADRILSVWPGDERLKNTLADFLAVQASGTASSAVKTKR